MPIDHEAIETSLATMKGIVDEMRLLNRAYETGSNNVSDVAIEYSTAQKQAIIDKYNTLKADLVTEFSSLP